MRICVDLHDAPSPDGRIQRPGDVRRSKDQNSFIVISYACENEKWMFIINNIINNENYYEDKNINNKKTINKMIK